MARAFLAGDPFWRPTVPHRSYLRPLFAGADLGFAGLVSGCCKSRRSPEEVAALQEASGHTFSVLVEPIEEGKASSVLESGNPERMVPVLFATMQDIAALVHAGIVARSAANGSVGDAIGRFCTAHGHKPGHSSDGAAPPEVTVQHVAYAPPSLACAPSFKEGDVSERGLTRDQQPRGQATNLAGGEDDVAYDKAECARERGHRGRRCVRDRRTSTDSVPNGSNEFFKRHRVRPGGVHNDAATVRGSETYARDVADVDRLHQVAAVARHDGERHASQDPGDVVGQDVPPTAEGERWPDDRVRNAGSSQRQLDECFAAVVRQRRIDRRIRDAHVNDASNASTSSSLEQRSRVGDGVDEGRPASLESDPSTCCRGW
jgi:hypothetical protein